MFVYKELDGRMIVNLAIGFVTPTGAEFIYGQSGNVPIESLSRTILGLIGTMLALMIITFIPTISL